MSGDLIARIEMPRGSLELVGHDAAAAMLADTWSGGRLAHAWLIGGPRGIGKATLAWRFTRFVMADGQSSDTDPLGIAENDPAAYQVSIGSHPDVRLVRRDYAKTPPHRLMAEIAVDNIRDLGPFLRQTSALGGWRVIIIDAADDMNGNAQNALLKLLEEPPARTLFLLVCHAPARLLPTIRSRCRMLRLRPLEEAMLTSLLHNVLPDLSPEEVALLARLADGAPGRAIDLAEAGGVDLFRDLTALVEALPDIDMVRLHALTDRFVTPAGEGAYRTFTGLVVWWLDRTIRALVTRTEPDDGLMAGEGELFQRISRPGIAPWLDVRDAILHQFERADAINLDRKQVVLNAFFGLAKAARN